MGPFGQKVGGWAIAHYGPRAFPLPYFLNFFSFPPIFFGRLVPLIVQNPMNSEERIRELSLKVAAASDGSEEFRTAMIELRAALNENARRARNKIAALKQKSFPHSAPDNPRDE
jgi:hypothetical protein